MIGDWLHGERDEGADARQLRYSRAEAFLDANRERPFLLGLALPAPSVPAQPNAAFAGKSEAGAYGDLLFEIDSIVGRLIAKLQALRIERSTLVIFSSANGAGFEGSNGPLRGRRGDAGYDGGYRVPLIAWAPGLVRAGTSDAILSGVDLLPTLVSLAGVAPPQGVELDGLDASAVLTRGAPSPREEVLLFDGDEVVAVRTRQWKYVERTSFRNRPVSYETAGLEELYDMVRDRSESYSVAAMNPYVAQDMKKRLARARARFAPLKRRA
jgi:arylsulfatase A-like enzyme